MFTLGKNALKWSFSILKRGEAGFPQRWEGSDLNAVNDQVSEGSFEKFSKHAWKFEQKKENKL